MPAYGTQDITSWPVVFQESRGLDPKVWVAPPHIVTREQQSEWWLYKPIKQASYRRYDDWSEKVASELAALLELPAARVELAQASDSSGIISRNVTPEGWTLESGDTMLSEFAGYVTCAGEDRLKNRAGHNLQNIARVLEGATGPPGTACQGWPAFDVFVGYLVFDAWIANTDRHAINWGLLMNKDDDHKALAASFDHGSALASGTQEKWLESTGAEDFARRGFAGRFENGAKRTLVDLALEAEAMAGDQAKEWRARLAAVPVERVMAVVASVPAMSELRRTFLTTLLDINGRRLQP